MNFIMLIYQGLVKPLDLRLFNRIELFNELLLSWISFHMFLFTDYVPETQMRTDIGYSMLFLIMVLILFNSHFLLKSILTSMFFFMARACKWAKIKLERAKEIFMSKEELEELQDERRNFNRNKYFDQLNRMQAQEHKMDRSPVTKTNMTLENIPELELSEIDEDEEYKDRPPTPRHPAKIAEATPRFGNNMLAVQAHRENQMNGSEPGLGFAARPPFQINLDFF